jgi:MarR family transcriptional regulator for hemolysin
VEELLLDCLGFRIGGASRRVDRLFNRALRPTGLSSAHVLILACLLGKGEQRTRDLAQLTGFESSTVSRLVRDLSRKRYVRYRPNPDDARSRLYRAAGRGEALRAEIERLVRHADDRLRRDLTQADLAATLRTIEIMDRLP